MTIEVGQREAKTILVNTALRSAQSSVPVTLAHFDVELRAAEQRDQ